MNKFFGFFFILIAAIFVIIGRVKSFHNTEGEALIYYWQYWLSATFFSFLGCFLISRNES